MSLIQLLLERKNYQVKYTSSRDNAQEMAVDFSPDIILVDVLQKNLIDDLKARKETAAIPIVLMTGYSLREHAMDVATDASIEKPFSIDSLQKIFSEVSLVNKHMAS